MSAEYSGELVTDSLENMDCGAVQAVEGESELSVDMLNFHEAVSQLQVLEEEVLDAHKSLMEKNPRWMDTDDQLFAMSLQVDYDQDGEPKRFYPRPSPFPSEEEGSISPLATSTPAACRNLFATSERSPNCTPKTNIPYNCRHLCPSDKTSFESPKTCSFSKQLMQRLTGQIAALEDVLNKVQVFREHLAAEEVMSQKMKRPVAQRHN
uniref:Uncharacterized protein n=1 Tax=Timema shepardi TaxID=629360 RepID=A0A7R9AUB0_TIMSH|nr:unnamed protein product [Timema shepardi]